MDKYKWRILAAVLSGSVMGPIDASIVNVIMPTIADAFGVDIASVSWVSMTYLLVLSSLLLTYGRMGDMWGFKRLYLSGLAIFALASALCGLAPSFAFLIAARALQALGAGMFMAVVPAIITSTFPAWERGKALGFSGLTVAAGLALGPSLGGFLTQIFGWKAAFYVNVPIGAASFIATKRVLPGDQREKNNSFDIAGSALAFIFLGSLLLVLSQGEKWGWLSPPVLVLISVAAVSLVLFVQVEKRVQSPMLDLSIFSYRLFTAANLASLANFMSQYVVAFMTPFYMQNYLKLEVGRVGLIMTTLPLVILVVAPFSGSLSDRVGTRWLAFSGQSACMLGLGLMTLNISSLTPSKISFFLAIYGLGSGLFQSPNNSAIMGSVPKKYLGIASSVLATVRNVGMVSGVAVATAVYTLRNSFYISKFGNETAFLFAVRDAYLVGTFIAFLGAVLALARGREERARVV